MMKSNSMMINMMMKSSS